MNGAASRTSIAVVGAGWSGLAAAVELTARGHRVTVFESADEPGGRARTVTFDGMRLDNGQHLLLGAYREVLRLMRQVGATPADLFLRQRLDLALAGPARQIRLRVPRGPAPWSLAFGLARAKGIPLPDRLRALAGSARLRRAPHPDTTVARWLTACGQPEALREGLWDPLCLAALNVAPERASARIYARVLVETFGAARHSDLLFPRVELGALFPHPAAAWLERHGASLHWGQRVRTITPGARDWTVDTGDRSSAFDQLVLATDPGAAAKLLESAHVAADAAARLRGLGAEPITTVYLRGAATIALDAPMVGRLDEPGQWLFDRRLTGQPGVISVVISGDGPHVREDRERLAARTADQIASAYPRWGRLRPLAVVREKRATFACVPGSEELRLDVAGPLRGLWFAGDHVATGLPPTLEGAVRAGVRCARAIDEAVRGDRNEARTGAGT